jgi:hypothetical protein
MSGDIKEELRRLGAEVKPGSEMPTEVREMIERYAPGMPGRGRVGVELKRLADEQVYVYEDERLRLTIPVPSLEVFEGDGAAATKTRGRNYGRIKFFGDRWTAFDEADADMGRVEYGVALGHLEIRKVSAAKITVEKKSEPVKKATSGKGRRGGSSKRRGKE